MFIIACAGVAGCHRARPLTETEQFAALLNKFYANEPACLWQQQTTLDETNYLNSGLLTGAMSRERAAALPENDWRSRSPEFKEPKLSENLALVDRLRRMGTH